MSTFRLSLVAVASLALLAACDPVRETQALTQTAGQQLMAKPGETVLTLVTEKNLPSEIFKGKADLLGRTAMTGLTTLQYRGVENGRAVFKRRTMQMASNGTDLTPATNTHIQNESDLNIFVNLRQPGRKAVVVEQRTLVITAADNQKILYTIVEPEQPKAAAPAVQEAPPPQPEPSVLRSPNRRR